MDMDSDISGDFTSLTMNLTDQPDYLTVTGTINPEDASEYLLTEGLSWNATATSATPAHGSFTRAQATVLKSPAYWAIKPATATGMVKR
ncbi:hypothetical protein JT306_00900 [Salmonella enterica subsp. enterica serovar Kentucky]|nr:hypothetical protein [Salmonella enterica subsp. enterica serovar Kentucky]